MTNKHKHYDLAYRAHYNTSFSPDKRAESACSGFDADMVKLAGLNIPKDKIAKYEALWVKWMNAKSRCLSSMITGPANFPVARNEKANNAERRAGDECMEYFNKIITYAEKEAFYAANPEARPVMAGDADAVERLKHKLDTLKGKQENMVAANKLIRKKDREGLVALLGLTTAERILSPDYMGRVGYATFELSNNRAEIKRLEDRINEIEKRKSVAPKEITVNGVRVVENPEAMRLQVFFEGKPPAEIIALMKSNAFKWAPSIGAWQRQLTNNAVYSFNHFVLPKLKEGQV